jgi:curved DNA-binding protein CbpA
LKRHRRDAGSYSKSTRLPGHPDKDRGNDRAEDNFIAIAGAYETLGNEDERKKFDMFGASGSGSSNGNSHGGGGGGSGGGASGFRWERKEFKDVNVDDIFKEFFKTSEGEDPLVEQLRKMQENIRRSFGGFHTTGGHPKGKRGKSGMKMNFGGINSGGSGGLFGSMANLGLGLGNLADAMGTLNGAMHNLQSSFGTVSGSSSSSAARKRTQSRGVDKAKSTPGRGNKPSDSTRQKFAKAQATNKQKDKAQQKEKKKKKKSKGSGCRYSVTRGEICD